MIASNVMTTRLLSLYEDALVKDAMALFRQSPMHELPVVDHAEKLLGEVSSHSILHRAVPAYASSELLAAMRAGPDIQSVYHNLQAMQGQSLIEFMTRDVQTVHADAPTSAVAAMLTSMAGDSTHVYVVDDAGRLLGVISPRDILCRAPESPDV